MPDYKKLYYKTFNALTDADRLIQQASAIIQTAQQECEDLYIKEAGVTILLSKTEEKEKV